MMDYCQTISINLPFSPRYTFISDCPAIIDAVQFKYGMYTKSLDGTTSLNNTSFIKCTRSTNTEEYHFVTSTYDIKTSNPLRELDYLIRNNLKQNKLITAFHGAATSVNGRAFIFLAATSVGKTTLTAFLTLKGLKYITDDCVIIDRNNFNVHPYCTPLQLRVGGVDILTRETNIDHWSLKFNSLYNRYSFMPPIIEDKATDISCIIFLKRSEKTNTTKLMNAENCLISLLRSPLVDYCLNKDYLHFVTQLSKKPCYELNYYEMDYILSFIESIDSTL